MNNNIYPCLTLKGKVAEAADFYLDTFGDGKIIQTSTYVIQLELSGQKLMLLNEGSGALPNPSISFMVMSSNAEETERYWNKLAEGGKVMMPLGSYDWSMKYGWVSDKFGVSWQLFTGNAGDNDQKFNPTYMFIESNAGKATEAIHFYTSLFPRSTIGGILKYSEGEGDQTDYVKHAQFSINNFNLMAMDSSATYGFNFTDAISLVVECDTQDEIDRFWTELIADGGNEVACGWLKDKYGLSWQIIPKVLGTLLKRPDKAQRVMEALLKMKKLVIADLEKA